jgi:hypothetical protein
MRTFIDRRTGLLKDNVQVICRGRGMSAGRRYQRFVCTVRAHRAGHQLRIAYRAAALDRFYLRWLPARVH